MERKLQIPNIGIENFQGQSRQFNSNRGASLEGRVSAFDNYYQHTENSTFVEHSSTKDFKVIKIVGKGSFGVVRQCKSLLDGQIYAVKTIPLGQSKRDEESRMHEVSVIKELSHPNIIQYKGSFIGLDFDAS